MKIIIDASWVAGLYNTEVRNGGYRVVENLLKQLHRYPEHQFILTHTTHLPEYNMALNKYFNDVNLPGNVIISAIVFNLLNNSWCRGLYAKANKYLPIPSMIPFINPILLNSTDIYHSTLNTIPYLVKNRTKIKKYFTSLDLIPLIRPDLSTFFYSETKQLYDKLNSETNVLAISESTKNDILKYRPDLRPEKIRVTYLASDNEIFYPIPDISKLQFKLNKYNLTVNKYFLSINSIAAYKNTKFVMEHFVSWIKEERIEDFKLVIIGKIFDEKYFDTIFLNETFKKNVIFFETISDSELSVFYNGALAFLYLSKYEGFGLPILESMMCGTPVISSNTSSMPEVAGKAALLIDPCDVIAFKKCMSEIFYNPNKVIELKQLGLKQASKFSWAKYADDTIEAYEQM